MPAGVGARLIDHDLVLGVQQVRGHEPGDARADDRDLSSLHRRLRAGLGRGSERASMSLMVSLGAWLDLPYAITARERISSPRWRSAWRDVSNRSAVKRAATKTPEAPPVNGTSEHQSLSKYIQARFDECSRSQKDVAQYIVDHLDEAAFQTAEELARRANTSSSTVVRFSQALGFEGFPELQAAAREEYRRVNAKAAKEGGPAGPHPRRRCSRSTRTSSSPRSRPTT